MRHLLVSLLFVCGVANAGGTTTAAWFATNWFKQQSQEPKNVQSDDDVIQPVGMAEYVKSCTELTSNADFCKKNWIEARMSGTEIILVPVERITRSKTTERQVVKKAKVEVTKTPKFVAESKVKGVNLLDVDNTEYKARRAATLAKPNAVVFHDTLR